MISSKLNRWNLGNKWLKFKNRKKPTEEIFTEIYQKRLWGNYGSRSGRGSDLIHTEKIRKYLPNILNELEITSILDIPCGDFYWLKKINLDSISYTGADIVNEMILYNQENYSKRNREFIKLDIRNESLPNVDLILCRDLFLHLSIADILKSIKNIKKSKSKYLLVTSNKDMNRHPDISSGGVRPINLLIPPFNFPRPIRIIDDSNIDNSGKQLLLFSIDILPNL